MEFWGVEVKPGQPLTVKPDHNKLIHISQAALGEVKNKEGTDSVPLRLKINMGKFVIGTLSLQNTPQLTFDLVFEKTFELSHDWKNGSVYFCGYTADNPYADDEDFSDEDEDEDHPLETPENGKLELKVEEAKPAAAVKPESSAKPATAVKTESSAKPAAAVKPESSAKPQATLVELKKDVKSAEDDDDEGEDSSDADEDFSDMLEEDSEDTDEIDDLSDDESDEDEETPKKAEPAKKRSSESVIKTPVPAKKAKSDTPQKTDGKKGGGHTATPYPSKNAGKTPADSGKSKEQTPQPSGQVSCKSCSKTFKSESALQSHTKAKHDGK